MISQSTIVLIAFWVLVQLVPLLIVWITYKITPDQKVTTSGPLKGINFKVVGALGAWLLTVTLMTSYSNKVFSFIADGEAPALKEWVIESDIMMLDKNGNPVTSVNMLDKKLLKITLAPDTYTIENGKLKLTVSGEELPQLQSFHIAYGNRNGVPIAEGFVPLESLFSTEQGFRLMTLHGVVKKQSGKQTLKLPFPVILKENNPALTSGVFNQPYTAGVNPPSDGGGP